MITLLNNKQLTEYQVREGLKAIALNKLTILKQEKQLIVDLENDITLGKSNINIDFTTQCYINFINNKSKKERAQSNLYVINYIKQLYIGNLEKLDGNLLQNLELMYFGTCTSLLPLNYNNINN